MQLYKQILIKQKNYYFFVLMHFHSVYISKKIDDRHINIVLLLYSLYEQSLLIR